MHSNTEKFPRQEAPEKNTDDAFVQVGKDGHPVMPQSPNDKTESEEMPSKQIDKDNRNH